MKGGYQCFSSDEPTRGAGVVYVDVNAKLGVKVQGPHGQQIVPLHNNIAFLHELGHAKQWIKSPAFFNGALQNTGGFEKDIKNAASEMMTKVRTRVETKPEGLGYSANKNWGTAPLQLTGLRLCRPGWSVRIETDNLMTHEWLICDEMRYPKRQYTDLVML